jgi:nucleotide-binding universal stress UspA family protein
MYEILLPVDRDTKRAAHQARYVSHLPDADGAVEATVLHVVPPRRFGETGSVEFEDVDAAVRAADLLEDAGVAVTRRVDDGGVSERIVRAADELGADEVVVGGRKRSGVAKVLLGSTVQDVLLSADRPVTVTGESVTFGGGPWHVLVPVDGSGERARHQAAYVAGLPDAGNVEATVLHVFRHQDYTGAPPHEFEDVEAAVVAAERLEEAGVAVERLATGGEVARSILDAAEDHDVDSIVVGGRKQSGVAKVLLGSTAQDVLLSATYPVTLTG